MVVEGSGKSKGMETFISVVSRLYRNIEYWFVSKPVFFRYRFEATKEAENLVFWFHVANRNILQFRGHPKQKH